MSSSTEPVLPIKRIPASAFVVGGLSFIPLLGVPFGLVAVGWGLISRRSGGKKLAIVGACGIGFTVLLYGSLGYFGFVQRGGIYDDLRAQMAQSGLNSLVQSVEFYKVQHGNYPDSLEDLRKSLPKDTIVMVFDPRVRDLSKTQYFYYHRVDADHYYLRGIAPDGKPFSSGALVPQVDISGTKLGLLTDTPDSLPADAQ